MMQWESQQESDINRRCFKTELPGVEVGIGVLLTKYIKVYIYYNRCPFI
jgi:hypothetical protein